MGRHRLGVLGLAAALATVGVLGFAGPALAGVGSGIIFTTDSSCTGLHIGIFAGKDDVYLDGGPGNSGGGLPDGSYYVRVSTPLGGQFPGTLLGTSIGSGNDTPVQVTGGEFVQCYQLSAILIRGSDGTPGYDTTPESTFGYRVCISQDPTFSHGNKCDGFKVKGPEKAQLHVRKFYDANANGINDDGQLITGWKFRVHDDIDFIRFTPVDLVVDPDGYTVIEFETVETNWVHTTPTTLNVTIGSGEDKTVYFGNVCTGAGGGLTKGFWSNKNGQALIGSDDLALLVSLNLRNANGSNFDPASKTSYRSWLLSANATNMAYMLSAQLSAMELNVLNGFVSGSSLIYAPGTSGANSLGFASVSAVMSEANAALGTNGLTTSGSPDRAYQEALKNALDNANNNLTFVQATPCSFSFADDGGTA